MWKIKTVFFISLLIIYSDQMAQEVNSKAYEIMLNTLLSHDADEIDVAGAKEMDKAIFIDSRAEKEFEVSHIPKAIWLGYENPKLKNLDSIDKETPLIIYCSVGYRSEKIALQLEEKGFKKVYNLYGGIFEWINQGNQVVDQAGDTTKKVHAYNRVWGIWLNKGEKVY